MRGRRLENMKFDAAGLVPAIIQDYFNGQVLMLAYMNSAALQKTMTTGVTWFYSRSKNRLWQKGETSGNIQRVKEFYYDCDQDALLIKVEQVGAACHTGSRSCFRLCDEGITCAAEGRIETIHGILFELYDMINLRKENPSENSYTSYLFDKGIDKILKKVGEEAVETIIAAKNCSEEELRYEMADLWYHCLVLLAWYNLSPGELLQELANRRKKPK